MAAKGPYKVKVTIGDAIVEVEGEEKGVVAIVQALSNVIRSDLKSASAVSPFPFIEPSQRLEQIDIRTFFQEKKPSSDIESKKKDKGSGLNNQQKFVKSCDLTPKYGIGFFLKKETVMINDKDSAP